MGLVDDFRLFYGAIVGREWDSNGNSSKSRGADACTAWRKPKSSINPIPIPHTTHKNCKKTNINPTKIANFPHKVCAKGRGCCALRNDVAQKGNDVCACGANDVALCAMMLPSANLQKALPGESSRGAGERGASRWCYASRK